MILRLLLTLSLAAPATEEAAEAAYSAGDLEAALKMYLELAEAPGAHPPRALDGAHTSLRAMHREDPQGGHLCRARDMARELVRRDAFASEQERGAWIEMQAEDERDLAGVSCPDAGVGATERKASPETEQAVLEESGERVRSEPAARAEGPAPLSVPKDSSPWRPRSRIAAASALGAVGLGLLGWMAGALAGRARANEVIATITADAMADGREFTLGERAAVHDANDRHRRLDGIAKTVGIAGGVILLTSLAVLLVPPRGASRARVRASGAGLVYSF
ncbi:hypothetical protein [Nannocystis punicea]|uniref:Tetratricopeptide repeat protein n=1 Tax=Nannocystis punicea TaxID=2995304 RepID=A0ABY7HB92_9BACT|nr:hypothetical protein [Nannocystis poenicansa]WAS96536.1 hypothetical protein O0S08_10295 [Nannocystis poenicansa]